METFVCTTSFYHYQGDISINKGDIIVVDVVPQTKTKFFQSNNALLEIEDSMLSQYFEKQ